MIIVHHSTSSTEQQQAGFASLAWLDGLISFIFRLLAKLAEPFLAFGLIASAIDYGSHGTFLHQTMLTWWIVTQALALEGSGGVALAMSFEAASEGDHAKMWAQRILALLLLIVGGIMFFVEISATARGFSEAALPAGYSYGMAGLRTVVSLGYIAICRTRQYRWSCDEREQAMPVQHAEEAAQTRQLTERLQALERRFDQVLQQRRTELAGQSVQIEACTEIVKQLPEVRTDPALPALAPEAASLRERVAAYIAEQRQERGVLPESKEIVEVFGCASSTARQYCREAMKGGRG